MLCSPFNLLVGVALSDVLAPNCGNFSVFKGSHHKILPMVHAGLDARAGLHRGQDPSGQVSGRFPVIPCKIHTHCIYVTCLTEKRLSSCTRCSTTATQRSQRCRPVARRFWRVRET
jgi:hypothetical protein